MHSKEAEKLRELIKGSSLLSDTERAEWLELLPMMNDKQLAELQAILVPPASMPPPIGQPASTAPPRAEQTSGPALSHIANLPSKLQFDLPPRPPGPVTMRPLDQEFAKRLRQTVEEKELPAPSRPPSARPLPPSPNLPRPAYAEASAGKRGGGTEKFVPTIPSAPAEIQPAFSRSEAQVILSTTTDVAKLEPQTFRRLGPAHLVSELRALIKSTDYFEVLFALEKSSLYKAYLQTGKQALHNEGFKGQQIVLSKEEFETLTDVLRQIQVNP